MGRVTTRRTTPAQLHQATVRGRVLQAHNRMEASRNWATAESAAYERVEEQRLEMLAHYSPPSYGRYNSPKQRLNRQVNP